MTPPAPARENVDTPLSFRFSSRYPSSTTTATVSSVSDALGRSASPYADGCGAGRRLTLSRGQSRAARPRPDYPRARAARGSNDREDRPRHAACHRSLRGNALAARRCRRREIFLGDLRVPPCREIDQLRSRARFPRERFGASRRGAGAARFAGHSAVTRAHSETDAVSFARGEGGGTGREERIGRYREALEGNYDPRRLRMNLFNGHRGCRTTVALD